MIRRFHLLPRYAALPLIAGILAIAGWVGAQQSAPPSADPAPAVTGAAGPTQGTTSGPQNIGTVVPGQDRQLYIVAVPQFEGPALSGAQIGATIMNDLVLSGIFAPPANAQFANEVAAQDRATKTVNYAEWRRVPVQFLVTGSYEVAGNELKATVRTYDVVSQAYVFGKLYQKYRPEEARDLAHRIANDVLERLTGISGFSNTRIAFIRQVDPRGKTKQLSVIDADGANLQTLSPQGELTTTPCWGKNGTEIYYTTYKDYNPDLAGIMLRTKYTWWISRRTNLNLSPSWSEAQQKIALTLSRDGNSEIYTITREGREPKRLTNNRAIDSSPSWNRDGTKIAFTTDRMGAGRPQIYVMDLNTGEERRVTYQTGYNDGVSWSQTGPDKLAFCARVDGEFQIYTCNPDGSELRQLTRGGNNEDPTWAPNGMVLAYTSDQSGSRQIHTMFLDGKHIAQLTKGAPCQSPAWSPARP